jgi:hypothetical protein
MLVSVTQPLMIMNAWCNSVFLVLERCRNCVMWFHYISHLLKTNENATL